MPDPENKINEILESARQMDKSARNKTIVLYSIIFVVCILLVYAASKNFQNTKTEYAALKDTLQYRDDTIQKLVIQKTTLINQFDTSGSNVYNNLLEENAKLKTDVDRIEKVNVKLQEANKNHDSVVVYKSLIEDKTALQEKNTALQKDILKLKENNMKLSKDNEDLKRKIIINNGPVKDGTKIETKTDTSKVIRDKRSVIKK